MKLYVVKNDDGKLWDYDDERWSANAAGDYTTYEWAAAMMAYVDALDARIADLEDTE